ncbi:hypothetical protein [Stratiformator vulcanicus]|uniref:Uncharacterized protein n=1 Tax=Stratiformator vulcanicus TaxID=2527980 RepID=A0A517R784_9PLAN|nr:hypothetical protein [Stratiformator vulcanicus]QDT39681.1 hypothetical protein Pan189_40900 [Stratiformator vulcanicus]
MARLKDQLPTVILIVVAIAPAARYGWVGDGWFAWTQHQSSTRSGVVRTQPSPVVNQQFYTGPLAFFDPPARQKLSLSNVSRRRLGVPLVDSPGTAVGTTVVVELLIRHHGGIAPTGEAGFLLVDLRRGAMPWAGPDAIERVNAFQESESFAAHSLWNCGYREEQWIGWDPMNCPEWTDVSWNDGLRSNEWPIYNSASLRFLTKPQPQIPLEWKTTDEVR